MSDVFGAMNDAASHENTTENQGRKSGAGIDFVGHLPGNDSGFQSSYVMSSMQTNSDPSMGYSQQSLFNNQISNYNSGVDYSQSGIRLDVSNNGGIEHELRQPVPSSYQHSYTQPHVSINNGLNLNTGPVINGNYSTLKHMHPHNLSNSETFGSAPQQPIVHQYTTVLQQNSSNLHSNPNQSGTQLPPGHSMSLSNDQLISRNISSHNPNSVQMSVHSMQTDNVSGISGSVSNQYIPMNRSVGIISQHHLHSTSQHQSPPQNYQIGGQPNLHYGNPSSANGNFQVNNANSSRSTISKVWHSSDHAQLREGVAEEIVKILKSRKPNAGDGWHDKLPHMAKRLEDALYQEASSYEEYADRNTLKHRLQQLALTMGSKNQSKPPLVPQNSGPLPPNASSAPAHQPQIVRQPQTHPNYSLPYMQNVQPQSHMHLPQHPPSQVSSQYSSYPPSQGPRSQLPSQYSQMSLLEFVYLILTNQKSIKDDLTFR